MLSFSNRLLEALGKRKKTHYVVFIAISHGHILYMGADSDSIQSLSRDIQAMTRDIQEFLHDYYRQVGPYYRDVSSAKELWVSEEKKKEQVRSHYRALARAWHPDTCPSAEQNTHYSRMFQQVQAAYEREDAITLKALRTLSGDARTGEVDPELVLLSRLKAEKRELAESPEYKLSQKHFRAKLCGVNLIEEIASKMRRKYSYQSHQHRLGLEPLAFA